MRKDIQFKTEDGLTLRGWHYVPDGRQGKAPTIVMAHGFSAGSNWLATLAGYAAGMDTDIDACTDDPFQGLVLLMRICWGPMFWPIIVGNVLAYLWCVYQVLV